MDGMDSPMDSNRVRELEAMVQKLQKENKLLLNKVDLSPSDENGYDSNEEFIVNDQIETQDDSWLYTSPVRPPTKEQQKITPLQWLEQNVTGQEKSSINETRQLLTFTLSEDEKFNPNRTPMKGMSNGVTTASDNQKKSDQKVIQKSTTSPPPMKIKWTPKAYSDSEEEEDVTPGRATQPTSIEQVVESSLKVSWDRSKPVAEDDVAIPNQWKVKQVHVPDDNGLISADTNEHYGEQRKWKVNQIPDSVPDEVEESTPQRQWKVKQVPSAPVVPDEVEEPTPQRQWKVKQVPSAPVVPDEVEKPTGTPQRQWKVKQVPSAPVVPDEVEESTPQRQWKVKQVPSGDQQRVPTSQKHAAVQRSGTFTKMQRPKIEQRGLRMVRAQHPSPTSDEDRTKQHSPMEGEEDEPNFTSYPTLTRPGKEKSPSEETSSPTGQTPPQGNNVYQRGLSPIRRGKSPLEYVRKDPRASRSPSPSGIRAPSPRRTAGTQLPAATTTRRQLPTPNRSPHQQITPPTTNKGQQMIRPPTHGGRGASTGVRRGSGLTKPTSGHSPQLRQPIPNSKHIRGGASPRGGSRIRQPVKPPPSQDESWLDECY